MHRDRADGDSAPAAARGQAGADRHQGRAPGERRRRHRSRHRHGTASRRAAARRGAAASAPHSQQAAKQIRDAVRDDPALADLARQLAIDITPEGLRIQLLDEEQRAMFATGSATLNDRARAAAARRSRRCWPAARADRHRRPYRCRALQGHRPQQLGTVRRPGQRDAPAADRCRVAGHAVPRGRPATPTATRCCRPIRWPPPIGASPSWSCADRARPHKAAAPC